MARWGGVERGGARCGEVGQGGVRWGEVGRGGARRSKVGRGGVRWVGMNVRELEPDAEQDHHCADEESEEQQPSKPRRAEHGLCMSPRECAGCRLSGFGTVFTCGPMAATGPDRRSTSSVVRLTDAISAIPRRGYDRHTATGFSRRSRRSHCKTVPTKPL